MDASAEKVVEQDVAISIIFVSSTRYHAGEDKFARQTQLGGRGGRQASEVRLPTAGGDDRVRACRGGIAQQELKLSQLIAAAAERHEIVTLGIDLDSIRRRTQGILDAMKTPNRSRPVQQAATRQRVKGLGKGHDHNSVTNRDTLSWLSCLFGVLDG
jgi:hypothetical protein